MAGSNIKIEFEFDTTEALAVFTELRETVTHLQPLLGFRRRVLATGASLPV